MSLRPERLGTPPPFLRALLTPLWAALLLAALVAQFGGTWRTIVNHFHYNPPYAMLGLVGEGGWYVSGAPGVAETAAIPTGSVLYRIGDAPVSESVTYETLSEQLAGPFGSRVSLGFALPDGRNLDVELQRSEATYKFVNPTWLAIVDRIILPLLGALAAGFGLFVSWKMWRRRDDPVAQVLAFGLIALVLTGISTMRFLDWLVPNPIFANLIMAIAYQVACACLVVAIPAFPDGAYRPRWSGWLALLAPVLLVAVMGFTLWLSLGAWRDPAMTMPPNWIVDLFSWRIFALLMLVAIVAAWRRFRATPAGRERQQVKWAALGIVFGILLILLAENVPSLFPLEGTAAVGIAVATDLLRTIGTIAVPLGLLMSLMGWRLNDADSAIGRSAGYFLITLLIGGVWAALTTWLNKLLGDQLSAAATAGISTTIAAAIFVPTRERILKWTEKKFQPALVRMRSLPARLLPWRADHNPEDVAKGTLLAIVNGLQASSAALVLSDGAGERVLATYETDAETVLADLAMDDPDEWLFPIHFKLDDLVGRVGYLLIGRRSDGASYNADERAAIKLVAAPLAEVLRATSRRADRNSALAQMLTAVDARVARLEGLRAKAG